MEVMCEMRRFVTIVSVLAVLLVASNAFASNANQFGWTISVSATDYTQNTGEPLGGPGTLYLWIGCSSGITRAAASEFGLSGTIVVSSVAGSAPQYLFSGAPTDLLGVYDRAPACPTMVGIVTVFDVAGGSLCLVPSGANDRNLTIGTDGNGYSNGFIGYSSDGSSPGASSTFCSPIAVESENWGSIKSMYR
jgi:hypothetical protein